MTQIVIDIVVVRTKEASSGAANSAHIRSTRLYALIRPSRSKEMPKQDGRQEVAKLVFVPAWILLNPDIHNVSQVLFFNSFHPFSCLIVQLWKRSARTLS